MSLKYQALWQCFVFVHSTRRMDFRAWTFSDASITYDMSLYPQLPGSWFDCNFTIPTIENTKPFPQLKTKRNLPLVKVQTNLPDQIMNPRTWVTPYECHVKRDIRQQANQKISAYPPVHDYIIASWKKKTFFGFSLKNLEPSFFSTDSSNLPPNNGISGPGSRDIVTIQHWGGQRLHLKIMVVFPPGKRVPEKSSRGENWMGWDVWNVWILYERMAVPLKKGDMLC